MNERYQVVDTGTDKGQYQIPNSPNINRYGSSYGFQEYNTENDNSNIMVCTICKKGFPDERSLSIHASTCNGVAI